ncbi:uncharacterized protein BDV14DRAFT_33495 [Aspergillus stella-maris]|uniref:uncharacterized protein n=1 Tax=Aspergillus stella-maris TaxID=1810926 RepID=UPI003CCCD30A
MVRSGFLSNITRRFQSLPFLASLEQAEAEAEAETTPRPSLVNFNRHVRWDDDDPYIDRAELTSRGIRDATCKVNGDIYDRDSLPTLPDGHTSLHSTLAAGEGKVPPNAQEQSRFFNLPPEIREIVYFHLLGGQKVHVDYEFREIRGDDGEAAESQRRWAGWHRICDDPDNCPKGKQLPCPETANAEKRFVGMGWKSHLREGFEGKLSALNWLRCCQLGYIESLPILYKTNHFALSHGVDQLHRLSRILPKDHLAMITSMEIEIPLYRINFLTPPPMDERFGRYYQALFDILTADSPGLRSLSLSFNSMAPWQGSAPEWTEEREQSWFGPVEALARSRRWDELSIGVSSHWLEQFRERKRLREEGYGECGYTLHASPEAFMKGW